MYEVQKYTVGAHAKKTTDTLTMTRNYRHIETLTDFTTGLTRHDQLCNRTKAIDKEEKRKGPRFAFLKISTSAHCTHLQSRTSRPVTQALQKSAILPALNPY
jgi:hypothetical protein